MQDLAAFMFLF